MAAESDGAGAPARWLGPNRAGLLAALAWIALALALLPAYGPTWDCVGCEFPLGEALLESALGPELTLAQAIEPGVEVPARAPHPKYVMEAPWWFAWPVTALLSAASCRLFWTELGWLPAVEAHHLPILLFTALLVFALVRWTALRRSIGAGLAAGALLLTSPRFFADSFNNAKDAPEACLYLLASLAGLRAFERGRLRDWLALGALAGAALAQKANAVFLAPQLGLAFVALRGLREPIGGGWRGCIRGALAATLLSALVYFALSPPLWVDPIGNLNLQIGHVSSSGSIALRAEAIGVPAAAFERIDWDGPLHALWTMPIATLLLAPIGLFASRLRAAERVFLALGVIIPVGRVALPGMTNFDGIRHFEEFLPPFCILAAAGLDRVAGLASRALDPGGAGRASARGRVAYAAAALALRDDLRVPRTNAHLLRAAKLPPGPLYVVYVTRTSAYGRMLHGLEAASTPVLELRCDGAPILKIHRLEGEAAVAACADWRRDLLVDFAVRRMFSLSTQQPGLARELAALFRDVERVGRDETLRRLREKLPEDLHESLAYVLEDVDPARLVLPDAE